MAGYYGIGIYHNKSKRNIGTLWRLFYLPYLAGTNGNRPTR